MSVEIIAQPSPQLVNDMVHISTSKWLWGLVFISLSGAARSQQNLCYLAIELVIMWDSWQFLNIWEVLLFQVLFIKWDLFLYKSISNLHVSGLQEMWLHHILLMSINNIMGII